MRRVGGILVLTLLASACGGDRSTEVFVGSASSFAQVMVSAQDSYSGDELKATFPGSQTLVLQLQDDAPFDVVITADLRTMQSIVDGGKTASSPALLARNRLVIAVESGNPLEIVSLSDLARPDVKVVLAGPEVPLGAYSEQVLQAAQVEVEPVSLAASALEVARLLELGEADAGLLYQTDLNVYELDSVSVPESLNVVTEYFIATVAGAPNPEGADRFVEFLLGPPGRGLLDSLGFLT